jgi:hypothetical protein
MDIMDRVPISPATSEAVALHDPAQVLDIVGAFHRDAVRSWIEWVGPAILNVPGLVSEPLKTDKVMHRLPGDAGQRHLTGEVEDDDVGAPRHNGIRIGVWFE